MLQRPNSGQFNELGGGVWTPGGDPAGTDLKRVFDKFCVLSKTMHEIEEWLDAESAPSSSVVLPSNAGVVVTLDNLDEFLRADGRCSGFGSAWSRPF